MSYAVNLYPFIPSSLRDVIAATKSDKSEASLDKNGIRSLRVSPDGRQLASGDRTGNIRIHDLAAGSTTQTIEAHDTEVLCLEFTDPQSTGAQ